MNWFFAGGDAPFFFPEQLGNLTFFPDIWRGQEEFGVSSLPALWIDYPFRFITFLLSRLGLSWFIIDKLLWGILFGIALVGAYQLGKYVGLSRKFAIISSIIYSTNTYLLMLFDGGQLGVSFAYAAIPSVLLQIYLYFTTQKSTLKIKETVKIGLWVSILIFLDLRIAYTFFVLLIPLLGILAIKKKLIISTEIIIIPIIILLINAYWLLPSIQYIESLNSIVSQTTAGASDLSFFSVADFPHSLSLLHPNYPENLFGRVYFFKPEFLFIPVLAFSLFLFTGISPVFIAFGFIALLGAFLAKGAKEPFGQVYELLFRIVPGFFLFRDPTKWYVLTAVSYSILIPKSLSYVMLNLFQHLKRFEYPKILKRVQDDMIILIFLLFWAYTLRFVFLGSVSGNITPPRMTQEYEMLKNILVNDNSFGRTLWLPSAQRFGYSSEIHPALSASTLLSESSPSGITRLFEDEETIEQIRSAGVSYVIVPEDIEKKIFLDNYIYSENLRDDLILRLNIVTSLEKLPQFTEMGVFKISNGKPLFSQNDETLQASASKDAWNINIPERKEKTTLSTLIAYDPNWQLIIADTKIRPVMDQHFTTFTLPEGKSELAELKYLPTDSARLGSIISLGTLLTIFGILTYFFIYK